MQDDKIISKIQKLLRMQSSPNEQESLRASAKVRELLTLHNLSLSDLPKEESDVGETEALSGSKTVKWKKDLLIAVAVFYDCRTITVSRRGFVATHIVGSQADTAVAISMFGYFCKAIDRVVLEEKAAGRLPDRILTFRHGVTIRIGTKLEDRKEQVARDGFTHESGNVSALVVQSLSAQAEKAIKEWLAQQHPDIKTAKEKTLKRNPALSAGYRAGDRIGIDTQLNPQNQRQLAGVAQ